MDEAIIRRAIRRVAEQRIREAMESGQFDELPGAGKPLPETDAAYDEQWWVRGWLRREGLERAGAALDAPDERRARSVAAAEVLRDAAADAKGNHSPVPGGGAGGRPGDHDLAASRPAAPEQTPPNAGHA
jgi:hypothetical protein